MKKTNKQKIERLVANMPDDISWDEAVYRINLLRSVETGRAQAERGEVVDDDDVEAWLTKNDQEATPRSVDNQSSRTARRHKTVHRS